MKKGSETKAEMAKRFGVKAPTLVSRMRRLGIKAETYVDVGATKVALYSRADVARIAADISTRPVLGRGWIKGKSRKEAK